MKELKSNYGDRFPKLVTNVMQLGDGLHSVLAWEMWRQWVSGSFLESPSPRTKVLALAWHIFMETFINIEMEDEQVSIFLTMMYVG